MESLEARSHSGYPLRRFFLSCLAIWLLAWLPMGLLKGDPDYVLTAVSRHTVERQIYQGLLYSGMLLVFLDCWRRYAPDRPARGSLADFARYAALGLGSATVLRAVLIGLGARSLPRWDVSLQSVALAVLAALAVAIVEEALFRGFLLGSLARTLAPGRALLLSSALFTAVHLFRPGPPSFKVTYALGLFLLAVLLGRIAWIRSSIAASAGFHAGVILPNLLDPWPELASSWWSGWQGEPAAGAVGWALTALLWAQWEWWQRRKVRTPQAP